MIARARVVVETDAHGRSRLTCLRSEGPLVLRPTPGSPAGSSPCPEVVVHLVGGAGGPLGGDVLSIEIVVGPGAELVLRSVAATVALPGPAPSVVHIDAQVGEGGALWWLPEPTIAAAGCDHRARARVSLASRARLVWREELVGGRHGEAGGSVSSRVSVDLEGRPLVRHQVDLGLGHPAWAGPAVGSGARCAGSVILVDPVWVDSARADGPARRDGPPGPLVLDGAAVLPLAGPAVHVVALAPDARRLRGLLDAGTAAVNCSLAPGKPLATIRLISSTGEESI